MESEVEVRGEAETSERPRKLTKVRQLVCHNPGVTRMTGVA